MVIFHHQAHNYCFLNNHVTYGNFRTACLKLSPCMSWRHTWGEEIKFQSFLMLTLDGHEWSNTHSDHFNPPHARLGRTWSWSGDWKRIPDSFSPYRYCSKYAIPTVDYHYNSLQGQPICIKQSDYFCLITKVKKLRQKLSYLLVKPYRRYHTMALFNVVLCSLLCLPWWQNSFLNHKCGDHQCYMGPEWNIYGHSKM